jgi:hypothetical protein
MAFLKDKKFWGGVAVGVIVFWWYQNHGRNMGKGGGGS